MKRLEALAMLLAKEWLIEKYNEHNGQLIFIAQDIGFVGVDDIKKMFEYFGIEI